MRVGIIDGDSILFVAGHPNKVLDEAGEPIKEDGKFVYIDKTEEELIEAIDNTICNRIITSSDADGYVLFLHGKGNYRYAIYPEYKANRPRKDLPEWWNPMRQYMVDKYKAVVVDGIEVDDACRITQKRIPNSFICAIDKDLLNLEGESFNWSKGIWIETTRQEADLQFQSDLICGQTGDNIKGVPGKGPKFVEQRFQNELDWGGVLDVYIEQFGIPLGVKEFYKNFTCLYILEDKEDFLTPEIQRL